jgi:hypothetical protein
MTCWSGAAHVLAPERLRRTDGEDGRCVPALAKRCIAMIDTAEIPSTAGHGRVHETNVIRIIDHEKARSNAS